MKRQNTEISQDDNKSATIVALLAIYEYIYVSKVGDETKVGFTLRELEKDSSSRYERFVLMMDELCQINESLDRCSAEFFKTIKNSWLENGLNHNFTSDVKHALLSNQDIICWDNNTAMSFITLMIDCM